MILNRPLNKYFLLHSAVVISLPLLAAEAPAEVPLLENGRVTLSVILNSGLPFCYQQRSDGKVEEYAPVICNGQTTTWTDENNKITQATRPWLNLTGLPLSLIHKNVDKRIEWKAQAGPVFRSNGQEFNDLTGVLAHKKKFMPTLKLPFITVFFRPEDSFYLPMTIILENDPKAGVDFYEQFQQKLEQFNNHPPTYNELSSPTFKQNAMEQGKISVKRTPSGEVLLQHGDRGATNKRKYHDFTQDVTADNSVIAALRHRQLGMTGIKRRKLTHQNPESDESTSITEQLL